MKVAVLGLGSAGIRHAANALSLGHETHGYDVAMSSKNVPDGMTPHESATALFAVRPDAAIVATPASSHAEGISFALRSGANRIFVEKPVAHSVPAVTALSLLKWPTTAMGADIRVGYNLRFHGGLKRMREILPERPRFANFRIRCNKASWPGKTYADMLLEGSHELDLALWMLGSARVVGSTGSGDRWSLLLQHESGCATNVTMDGGFSGYDRTAEVIGASGDRITHRFGPSADGWWMREERSGFKTDERYTAESVEATYRLQMHDFLLASGPKECCTLKEGLDVLRLCDAARWQAEISTRLGRIKSWRS